MKWLNQRIFWKLHIRKYGTGGAGCLHQLYIHYYVQMNFLWHIARSAAIYIYMFKYSNQPQKLKTYTTSTAIILKAFPPGSQTPNFHPATPGRSIVFDQLQLQNLRRRTNSLRPSVGWLPSWVLVGVCGNSLSKCQASKCQAYSWETSVSCLKIHHETFRGVRSWSNTKKYIPSLNFGISFWADPTRVSKRELLCWTWAVGCLGGKLQLVH